MVKSPVFKVKWADTAAIDLAAITDYIAADDVGAALLTLEKLEQTATRLTTMSLRGRIVPELAAYGIQIYRELIYPPWRIIYRITGKVVNVLAVVDSRRNLEDLLLERFVREA